MTKLKKQYTTDQLQKEFKIIGFSFGYVAVQNKVTLEKGSFNFGGTPRLYFDYKKA